ncbi:MAG TPA: heme o synthase, partial [Gammaproteobacteria bacterium]
MQTLARPAVAGWRDYLELGKPRVVALIVFTAVCGMFLAVPGWPAAAKLLFGTLGIALAATGAAAINHVLDRRLDAVMYRTRHRPLPTHRVSVGQAMAYATALNLAAMALLAGLVNPLSAALTFCSLVGYAVIYTVFLKHATPQNIVIGGAAGAAPPLLGWVAVTGQVAPGALVLFLIILVWTPPHFWALAIHRREDYAKVGVPMLPVTHGVACTKYYILVYTVLLAAVSVLPYAVHMSGVTYVVAALGLDAVFLWHVWRLLMEEGGDFPMRTFRFSIWYL